MGSDYSNISRTKFYPPDIREMSVWRSNILEGLKKSSNLDLILFSAPAGYGKSSTVAQWLDISESPYVWISLDKRESDINLFLECLVCGLKGVFPKSFDTLEEIITRSESPDLNEVACSLVNEIEQQESSFILVLDDYYLIKSKEVDELLDTILAYPLSNLKVILSTRRDPGLKLNRLRGQHRMLEFRMNQLAFDKAEIQSLSQKLSKKYLADATIQQLKEMSEGWIVGLRLVLEKYRDEEDLLEFCKSNTSNLHAISEYLLEQVVEDQSKSFQDLMMTTSILSRFNLDFITFYSEEIEAENGKGIFDVKEFMSLVKSNPFLISLDDHREWFRYHHLLEKLLQNKLALSKSEEEIRNLHLLASRWFEKKLMIEEAMNHAKEAQDLEEAAAILVRNRDDVLNADRPNFMARLISMIPLHISEKRISLIILLGCQAQVQFNLEKLLRYVELAEEHFSSHPQTGENYGVFCYQKGWIKLMLEGDVREATHLFERALPMIPQNSLTLLMSENEMLYALALAMEGKKKEAKNYLKRRIMQTHPSKGILYERMAYGLAAVDIIYGDMRKARYPAKEFLDYSIENKRANVECWGRFFLGVIELNGLHLEKAKEHFEGVIALRYVAEERMIMDSFVGLAMTFYWMNEKSKAQSTLKKAAKFAEWTKNPEHFGLLNSGKARLAMLDKNPNLAKRHLDSSAIEAHVPSSLFFFELPYVTKLRWCVMFGPTDELDNCTAELRELKSQHGAMHNYLQMHEISVLIARAQLRKGNEKACTAIIREELLFIKEKSYVRAFIENGEELLDVLITLKTSGFETSQIQKILDACEQLFTNKSGIDGEPLNESDISVQESPHGTVLSIRESEIANWVIKGLRNKEIADKLYISEHTVKKHLSNIFKKFDVKNRGTFVAKLSEMNASN